MKQIKTTLKERKLSLVSSSNRRIEKEVKVHDESVFYYKIDLENNIDYINHQYTETSGFESYEIINKSLSALFHSDMPNLFESVLLERIKKGKAMRIIQKNKTKEGDYFWLLVHYMPKFDNNGVVQAYTCTGSSVALDIVQDFMVLYDTLSKIEAKTKDVEASKKYLIGFLESRGATYDSFIKDRIQNNDKMVSVTENSNEAKDYILSKIKEEQEKLKNKKKVSYSKKTNLKTLKYDFKSDINKLKRA